MAEFRNMNPVRIAIIDAVGLKAGLDHYDLFLAKALLKRSVPVKIYSNFSTGDQSIVEKVFSFSPRKNIVERVRVMQEFFRALRKAKKDNSEVVILHLFHASLAEFGMIKLTSLFKFRICLIIHDIEPLINLNARSWMNECVKLVSSVIVHNAIADAELKKKISSEYFNKIHVVPHGNFTEHVSIIDRNTALKYFNLLPDKKYILFFGMIKNSKGLDVLIDAMKRVSNGCELIIAGNTRDVSFKKFRDQIIENGLSSRIHSIIRYITNEERNLLFNITEAVILPYRRIYQSGIMIMAMSYGIPVIASDLPANRLMLNGKNGLLFKVGDSSDLAKKINDMFSSEGNKISMGEEGKKYVTGNNNWELISNEFINILK